jgi:hypothetical protein
MGGEKDIVEALKIGELEMGVLGTYPIVTLTPKYSFFDAPFVFRDKDHVYKTWNGKLGEEVREAFRKSPRRAGARHHGARLPPHHLQRADQLGRRPQGHEDPDGAVEALHRRLLRHRRRSGADRAAGAVHLLKLGVVSPPTALRPDRELQAERGPEAHRGHGAPLRHLALAHERAFYQGLSRDQRAAVDAAAKEALAYGDELSAGGKREGLLETASRRRGMQFTKPDVGPCMA